MYELNRSTKPRLRLGGWPCQVLTARLDTFTSGPTWKRRGVQRTGICHRYRVSPHRRNMLRPVRVQVSDSSRTLSRRASGRIPEQTCSVCVALALVVFVPQTPRLPIFAKKTARQDNARPQPFHRGQHAFVPKRAWVLATPPTAAVWPRFCAF